MAVRRGQTFGQVGGEEVKPRLSLRRQFIPQPEKRAQTAAAEHRALAHAQGPIVQAQLWQRGVFSPDHPGRDKTEGGGIVLQQDRPAGCVKRDAHLVPRHLAQRNDGGNPIHQGLPMIQEGRDILPARMIRRDAGVDGSDFL